MSAEEYWHRMTANARKERDAYRDEVAVHRRVAEIAQKHVADLIVDRQAREIRVRELEDTNTALLERVVDALSARDKAVAATDAILRVEIARNTVINFAAAEIRVMAFLDVERGTPELDESVAAKLVAPDLLSPNQIAHRVGKWRKPAWCEFDRQLRLRERRTNSGDFYVSLEGWNEIYRSVGRRYGEITP